MLGDNIDCQYAEKRPGKRQFKINVDARMRISIRTQERKKKEKQYLKESKKIDLRMRKESSVFLYDAFEIRTEAHFNLLNF